MNRQDYNFTEYQMIFNEIAKKVITESFREDDENFDADAISEQIDDSQITYNKIQKILNCPEMIKSHAYLYALDMENVSESDKSKIDHLYDLGKARGVIQEDEPEEEVATEDIDDCDDRVCGGPDDALTDQEMTPGETEPVLQSSAFTVLYSAMKDGEVKTGEYFSSATDMESAQRDCINGLSPLGYNNIRVLGIEKTQNAVDMDTISEDDSEEYEEQETEPAENEADSKDEQPEEAEDKSAEEEEPVEDETSSEKTSEDDKESEKQAEEEPAEEKPEDEETEEPAEEPAEDDKTSEEPAEEEKKLTPEEKKALKEEYSRIFKAELQKTKLNKSVNDMSIGERAKFWTAIAEKWTKNEPEDFMTKTDIENLNSTVIKTK